MVKMAELPKDKAFGTLGLFYWSDTFLQGRTYPRQFLPCRNRKEQSQGYVMSFVSVEASLHYKEVSMQLERKTNEQLLTELHLLKERVRELETAESDCKEAKKALRNAETLLSKVFESGSGLLSVFDKDLRIIYSTWLGSHEDSPGETGDQTPFCRNAHCPGQGSPCDPCHIREVFETARPVIADKTSTRIGHLEAHAYPLFDDSGRVALVVEKAINITERKRALQEMRVAERTVELGEVVDKLQKEIKERERTEQALRRSEERYALAVDGANDGLWDIDLLKGEVFYSPRWKQMLGYKDDEISASLEEWESRIHPDDYEAVMEARKAYLEGLSPTYEVKYRLRHKDGSYRWIRAHGSCLRDSQGKPYRMAGSHTDVTERKRIKSAFLESEKRYRELFEESKDTAFIVDSRGKLVDINPAGSELLGYTRQELLALDLVHDLHVTRQVRAQFRKQLVPEGYVKDAELELRNKDGGTVVVHVSASLMHDAEGRLSGYRGIAHDVTERKRLEQQLLQARKMESIGLLAGGVAHEFNNLLTAVIGCADELQESIDTHDKRAQTNIHTIQLAAKQAVEVTRNLLSFSRKQVLTFHPVMINDVITDTLKLIHKVLSAHIDFSLDLSREPLSVMADRGQLNQVLINLAINAKDSMPDGGQLKIKTWPASLDEETVQQFGLEAPGDYAVLSVTDTGKGMDQKTLDRIFDPFFTTKEVGKGTGLGLPIVYGIIKQHRGSIHVESKPGEGTDFRMYLPRVHAEIPGALHQETLHPKKGIGTILVADDEEFVRIFLKTTLSRAGYRLILAADGEEAFRKFKKHRDTISLVISDMVMPKMNGRVLYEEICKINPCIKMIFISGYSADMITGTALPADQVRSITKPFSKKVLFDEIQTLLVSSC
jgi:PAS domain S-box-containing protein